MSRFRASQCYNLIGRKRGDKTQLSLAAQKYVRSCWLANEKGFDPPVIAKQMTKGIRNEAGALLRLGHYLNADLKKCREWKSIPELHFSGTCDTIHEGTIIDVKCPWDASGFMEGDFSKAYEWQLRAYMMLYNEPKAMLAYVLTDIPDDLWEDEKRKYCWQRNIIDDSLPEVQEELTRLRRMYYYSENPLFDPSETIKVYDIERDQELENLLTESLRMANEYYESLYLTIKL